MEKREVVKRAIRFEHPPYVPWQIGLTRNQQERLAAKLGSVEAVEEALENHFLMLGENAGFFTELGDHCVRDYFGVVWDRSSDRDIGVVRGQVLPEPTLANYRFPDPRGEVYFGRMEEALSRHGDRFRMFNLGFSLFERAWTLRGMTELLMDFHLNPEFVHELFARIVDYNLEVVEEALKYDIDCVYFGDDWGQQHGLLMGYPLWREFLYPELKRQYARVVAAGKLVCIHSCGDVDELFDDLVGIGLNCFNPFQPEVMDVHRLLRDYHGKLCFFGGLSTQRLLPYGTPEEVAAETRKLLAAGRDGGLILAPAHAVPGDVPPENLLAMLAELKKQPGAPG